MWNLTSQFFWIEISNLKIHFWFKKRENILFPSILVEHWDLTLAHQFSIPFLSICDSQQSCLMPSLSSSPSWSFRGLLLSPSSAYEPLSFCSFSLFFSHAVLWRHYYLRPRQETHGYGPRTHTHSMFFQSLSALATVHTARSVVCFRFLTQLLFIFYHFHFEMTRTCAFDCVNPFLTLLYLFLSFSTQNSLLDFN